jgi:RNA polymerase sigma-70 factor, ECF subfamily
MGEPQDDVTRLLADWSQGSEAARDRLLPVVYEELHRIARRQMMAERPGHTLQPTALVHEAYLRLVGQSRTTWKNRAQFFGVAANMMRRILVDYARRRASAKRQAEAAKAPLEDAEMLSDERARELVALDDALTELAGLDPELAHLVELRYFAGMTIEETAEALQLSPASVKREWATAKAWLHAQLSDTTSG